MYMFIPYSKSTAVRNVIRHSVSVYYSPKMGVNRSKYYNTYLDVDNAEHEDSIFEDGIYGTPSGTQKNSGTISMSIDNNIEMKVRNDKDTTGENEFKKIKILESLRIGTSYDIFADSMNWSNIQITARTKLFNDKLNLDVTAVLDPYAVNVNGTRIHKFHGGLGRLRSVSASTGFQFSSDDGNNREEKNELVGGFYDYYVDFDVPLDVCVVYTPN